MRMILGCVLLLLSGFSYAGGGDPAGDGDTDTVAMSFNLLRETNSNDWENRFSAAIRAINAADPDIVGIQEGYISMLHSLEEGSYYTGQSTCVSVPMFVSGGVELSDDYDRVGSGRNGGTCNEYNAIYFKTSRYDLLNDGQVWLADGLPDYPVIGWDASLYRIVTWAKLYDKNNKTNVFVFNTHFSHVGSTARNESAKLLREFVFKKALKNGVLAPTIITGDFNASKYSTPYNNLTQSYSGHSIAVDAGGIDWIGYLGFNSNGFTRDGNKYKGTNGTYIYPSDHDPIFATYTMQ